MPLLGVLGRAPSDPPTSCRPDRPPRVSKERATHKGRIAKTLQRTLRSAAIPRENKETSLQSSHIHSSDHAGFSVIATRAAKHAPSHYKAIHISTGIAKLSPRSSCPRISHFSWQDPASSLVRLQVKPRHIEIVIPDWAGPSFQPRPLATPDSLLSGIDAFPQPPSTSTPPSTSSLANRHLPIPARTTSTRHFQQLTTPKGQARQSQKPLHISPTRPLPIQPLLNNQKSAEQRVRCDVMADGAQGPGPTAGLASSNGGPAKNLSSLVCNVHRTTGEKPPALVGASTTVSGDKLYVFGGRRLSRQKQQLTKDLYELDLIGRHWTRLQVQGTAPAPRYFHSVCALGDTKLVCYGGMSAIQREGMSPNPEQGSDNKQAEPGISVMSDVHIYDIATRNWTLVHATNAPPGRYAHCAAIQPSSGVFTSDAAALGALRHNTANATAVPVDGRGGAEMVIVGGQDGDSQYIEQVSVFNLRSMSWTTTTPLGKSCGAYRSVVTPMTSIKPSQVGQSAPLNADDDDDPSASEGYGTLIYSNYNFLNVQLELQLRTADGRMIEKTMNGPHTPPGLRFPNGDIVDNHFVVSGTFLTSTRQEYALWALDLRTLTWTRIDAGPGILTSGSWNRGMLWKKRNTFVVLGDRRRSLAEDYEHRRLNFANMCTVELEAFGLYDNPVTTPPASSFVSASNSLDQINKLTLTDRAPETDAAKTLGRMASELRELADMDLMAVGGERLSVSYHIIARRWGPYLTHLLQGSKDARQANGVRSALRPSIMSQDSRNSSVTITQGSVNNSFASKASSALDEVQGTMSSDATAAENSVNDACDISLDHSTRARLLYLPHTVLTIKALVYYLYTWSLPPVGTPLCTPQVLCSLLQIARPYRINGLLEATVERLHQALDSRNTAAVFNAAAMAAGGGESLGFVGDALQHHGNGLAHSLRTTAGRATPSSAHQSPNVDDSEDEGPGSSVGSSTTSLSGLDVAQDGDRERVWAGELSAVVGLQKRGLRGLMEGRKLRERSNGEDAGVQGPHSTSLSHDGSAPS